MKPAPFAYLAARTLDEALAALAAEEDAVALAGGQSLVPLMNVRLARPSVLVDLNPLEELSYLRPAADGSLRIGAMTRQVTLERSPLVAHRWPLLAQAVRHAGHPATRTRGTIGGSVAHADPRAELPAALLALDARFRVRSARGERTLSGSELFRGPLMTALAGDELLTEIKVSPLPHGARTAFLEHARASGDFALAGTAVMVAPERAAIALVGAGPTPVRAPAAEAAVVAGAPSREAAALAVDGIGDEYRRALLAELVERALMERAVA